MSIWYLPLEPLEMRYTKMMHRELSAEFTEQSALVYVVHGTTLPGEIQNGSFLDSEGTIHYKTTQLAAMARNFREGRVKDGDTVFVSDLWFPGIESLKYMAYFRGIRVHIKGILHAGSWTPSDYVADMSRSGTWVHSVERAWVDAADEIFVGSQFHKKEIVDHFGQDVTSKIRVTGLPFSLSYPFRESGIDPHVTPPWDQREDIVLFVGRLDAEKRPQWFDQIAKALKKTGAQFIKTHELKLTKPDYFRLLAKSKVVFSAPMQENFGYAVAEAALFGVHPVLYRDVVYPEFYGDSNLFSTIGEAKKMVEKFLTNTENYAMPVSLRVHLKNGAYNIVSRLV